MKKVKYLLLILLVFLAVNVKAESKCEKTELTRLKELAKKVEFDYDYTLNNDQVSFSITAVNLNSELKVMIVEDYYLDKYKEFKNSSTHTATLDGFKSGEKVVITTYAFVPNSCSGTTVSTKTIKLPYYNYFYSEEKCKGNEDFKYCKLLINNNVSQEEFNIQYELYLKAKEENNTQEVVPPTNSWRLLIIISSIILVLIVLVIITMVIVRRRKKNSL